MKFLIFRKNEQFLDNHTQQKAADPHLNHFHKHQHGFSHVHLHEHGIKPMHELNQFPPSNFPATHLIQNQHTIIHQSNPSIHHSGTFGHGNLHQSGAHIFPPVPMQFGQQIPNKNIIINQNQNINDNLLKSEHLENERENTDLFTRVADSDPSRGNDMVSRFFSV